ncbi:MAG: BamA/TamA family outer membrane protein [Bacteroidales bacterium]|nr:BamA/TamA family outer membrane protein [Bacteroidales bacterium]
MNKCIILILFLIYGYLVSAQINVQIYQDGSTIMEFEAIDSLDIHRKTQNFLSDAFNKGYLYANLEPDSFSEKHITYKYYPGPKVYLQQLNTGNAEEELVKKLRLNSRKMSGTQVLRKETFSDWQEKIIEYYENNGYPFCRIALQITELDTNSVSAAWNIDKGLPIVFDSIVMKGKYRPAASFVGNWLGIERGALYDERKIKMINERIRMSDIAVQTDPFNVFFSGDKAKIYLYLSKKKSSSFDGIVGFAPDPNNPAKLLFNGDVFLKVNNSFNHGEKIMLRWKNSGEGTQEVKISAAYPFIAGLPLGLTGMLEIFKKDSSWVKSTQRYGISYYSGIRNESGLFFERNENRVIARSIYEGATSLPSVADSKSTFTGLQFTSIIADDIIVPRRGFSIATEAAMGQKEILKNEAADESIYDSLQLESGVFRAQCDLNFFLPIKKSWHVMIRNYSGILESNSTFENDAFLLGGLQNLRGFDEKSISASKYSIFTGEIRFFLEKRSYINLFSDFAWAQVFESSAIKDKRFFSVGTGISFSTRAGIFSIFYALGKEESQDFNIKNGKVHFGIVTVF